MPDLTKMETVEIPTVETARTPMVASLLYGPALIVEDDASVAKVMADALGGMFESEIVGTAAEGLARVKDKTKPRLSVIVLDLRLPNGEGIDLVRRYQMRAQRIPMVATSGYDYDGRKVLEAGAQEWMPKPFTPAIIRDKVQNAIARHVGRWLCIPTEFENAEQLSEMREYAAKIEQIIKPKSDPMKA